ncbi:HNH nuclease [Knoellia sinensis KCTC 19936]|uniref:HNH nuclease n=1 Tax=Knoellia sinensis KCTC 19936 TaxID=1385520 RepID=A0A0A0J9D6_9MICO|nr:HNH endonuclease signature motif containing protein [Knoellia sinensis]KGN33389.1 HNH nuclease [Knoellia sinensis KCTC 19936]
MDMEQSAGPVAQLRAVLMAARDGLSGVGPALASLSAAELAEVMTLSDEVKAQVGAVQVRVVGEAASRGEFTAARRGVGSGQAWVREHAPSLRQGGAGQVAQFAQEAAAATPTGSWVDGGPVAGVYADPERPEGVVWARVVTGEVGPELALATLREMGKLKDRLVAEAIPTVAGAMLDHGSRFGAGDTRRVRAALLAKYGAEGEFDEKQKRLRAGAYLSSPQVADGDVSEYRMGLTPEQAARLEAAIGPLSKPVPDPVTGEADLRPAGQRRVEALHAVLGKAVGADAAGAAAPGGAATVVHVSITLAELLAGLAGLTRDTTSESCGAGGSVFGAGVDAQAEASAEGSGPAGGAGAPAGAGLVMGSRVQGTMLAPSVVRQLACDADVIPVVLGAEGEVLDLGRATRLFTRGQRRMLWHRDRECTFPGCGMPSSWAQAHHLVHWADGGPSDAVNAALLCQRHHTQVHEQRLIGTVGAPDEWGRCVTWDLTPGSYDRELAARLAQFRRAREGIDDLDDSTFDAAGTGGRGHRRRPRPRLDTGPSEGWVSAAPDDVSDDLVADLEADHLAAGRADWLHDLSGHDELPGHDDLPWDIPA